MSRIERTYGAMFGSQTTKGQLYGGFYCLMLGFFGGLAALVLFVISNNQPNDTLLFAWREAAIIVGAFSLPLIFFGIQLSLPSKKALTTLSFAGMAMVLLAIVLFNIYYPKYINVADSDVLSQSDADKTSITAGLYVLGVLLVLPGTFTSLIGYYVDRVAAATATGNPAGTGDAWDPNYDVPDSVIEKDIEYAMRKYKYAWGEGEGSNANAMQINIADSFAPGVVVGGGKGVARTVTLETPQVDDATSALRNIRPSKDKTMSSEWADEQTNALLQFRKQKAAMPQKFTSKKLGWWARLMQWLGLRREGSPVQKADK